MFRLALFAVAILIAVQALAEEKPSSPAKGQGPLDPGDQTRTLQVDGRTRSYLVHVPPKLDPQAADAGRAGLPWGGDQWPDHGPLQRPQRQGRRGRVHRRLSQRNGQGRHVPGLECGRLAWPQRRKTARRREIRPANFWTIWRKWSMSIPSGSTPRACRTAG